MQAAKLTLYERRPAPLLEFLPLLYTVRAVAMSPDIAAFCMHIVNIKMQLSSRVVAWCHMDKCALTVSHTV